MKNLLLLILFFLEISCAQTEKMDEKKIKQMQLSISPGEVRWISFPLDTEQSKLICRSKEVKFVRQNKMGFAFIVESYFSELKPFTCQLLSGEETFVEFHFRVTDKVFVSELLKVDTKKVKLSPRDEKRVHEEQLMLNKIYESSPSDFLFTQAFIRPLNSVLTSSYGTKRVFNKQKKGQHLGIDYRAAIGDKVPAANSGKVVVAGDLFYTGWTVIIDHGLDIFTIYGHLSRTLVTEGEFIKRGEIIGLSGNTGRTSGPHLHWGVKIQGNYIDGHILIDESLKHFNN
jgi:murein DD-endopeptidase MepM/ murein hydrolase activator NlpD